MKTRRVRAIAAGVLLAVAVSSYVVIAADGHGPRTRSEVGQAAGADRRCPHALAPGRDAPVAARDLVLGKLRRIFAGTDLQGARIFALIDLNPADGGAVGLDPRLYARKVAAVCGNRTAARSWAVFVHLPNAPMATTGDAAVIATRTPAGWRAWYVIYPAARTQGFVKG